MVKYTTKGKFLKKVTDLLSLEPKLLCTTLRSSAGSVEVQTLASVCLLTSCDGMMLGTNVRWAGTLLAPLACCRIPAAAGAAAAMLHIP